MAKNTDPRPCEVCGTAFTPTNSIGRPPKVCPDCKEKKVNLVPSPLNTTETTPVETPVGSAATVGAPVEAQVGVQIEAAPRTMLDIAREPEPRKTVNNPLTEGCNFSGINHFIPLAKQHREQLWKENTDQAYDWLKSQGTDKPAADRNEYSTKLNISESRAGIRSGDIVRSIPYTNDISLRFIAHHIAVNPSKQSSDEKQQFIYVNRLLTPMGKRIRQLPKRGVGSYYIEGTEIRERTDVRTGEDNNSFDGIIEHADGTPLPIPIYVELKFSTGRGSTQSNTINEVGKMLKEAQRVTNAYVIAIVDSEQAYADKRGFNSYTSINDGICRNGRTAMTDTTNLLRVLENILNG